MKKWMFILGLTLIVAAGCSQEPEETVQEPESEAPVQDEKPAAEPEKESKPSEDTEPSDQAKEEKEKEETNESSKEMTGNSDKKKESKNSSDGPYKAYRPKTGATKQFEEQGTVLLTETITAANDDYVQIALRLGDSTTTQIYKWTGSEMTLVYEDRELQDHTADLLDTFEPNMNEKLLGEGADWKLLDSSKAVDTPFGKIENAVVIQKTSNEVVGEETIFTRYYAPGLGLVREDFELTGENGYKGESSLSSVE